MLLECIVGWCVEKWDGLWRRRGSHRARFCRQVVGNAIDSDIGLSITIDNLRVFINKTLSILNAYQ
jgi:hypothetical protein